LLHTGCFCRFPFLCFALHYRGLFRQRARQHRRHTSG
jgi:hypothetical protein